MGDELPDIHRDPEAAAEMAANAVLYYMRKCEPGGQEECLKWLQDVLARATAKVAH